LYSSTLKNPEFIMSVAYLPLMISIGLLANLFIDPPLRRWMKNVMTHVSMPLLILDLAIIALSVYLSFRLRFFSDGREYAAYRSSTLVMFWSAFIFRTTVSIIFKTLRPNLLYLPFARLLQKLGVAVSVGSMVVAGLVYASFLAGWIENFPRSIFLIDWLVVLTLSLTTRYLFRLFGIYGPNPLPAQASKAARS